VLGAAGLLQGKRSAAHWMSLEMLSLFGAIPVAERVVKDGNLFTGGGVTAGIDCALAVAAEAFGEEVARAIQLVIEYAPEPPYSPESLRKGPIAAAPKPRRALIREDTENNSARR
jgi:cyclohexyl-isocyanide hydratase